jgi:hypothetical protein
MLLSNMTAEIEMHSHLLSLIAAERGEIETEIYRSQTIAEAIETEMHRFPTTV